MRLTKQGLITPYMPGRRVPTPTVRSTRRWVPHVGPILKDRLRAIAGNTSHPMRRPVPTVRSTRGLVPILQQVPESRLVGRLELFNRWRKEPPPVVVERVINRLIPYLEQRHKEPGLRFLKWGPLRPVPTVRSVQPIALFVGPILDDRRPGDAKTTSHPMRRTTPTVRSVQPLAIFVGEIPLDRKRGMAHTLSHPMRRPTPTVRNVQPLLLLVGEIPEDRKRGMAWTLSDPMRRPTPIVRSTHRLEPIVGELLEDRKRSDVARFSEWAKEPPAPVTERVPQRLKVRVPHRSRALDARW